MSDLPSKIGTRKVQPPQPAGAGGAELAHRSLVAGVAVGVLRLSSSDSLRMTAMGKAKSARRGRRPLHEVWIYAVVVARAE
jgi:hypothetical protein